MGHELNILQIILHSGIVVKIVLLILIVCSILSWAIVIQKIQLFKKFEKANRNFLNIYNESDDLEEIILKSKDFSESPFKMSYEYCFREFHYLMANLNKGKGVKDFYENLGVSFLDRPAKRAMIESQMRYETLLSTLASIGSVAPFIGLFGTVWGIINAFQGLSSGSASLDVVAPGIAEALVATAVGLAAAIPAVWCYNYLSGQVNKYMAQLESFIQDIMGRIDRDFVKNV